MSDDVNIKITGSSLDLKKEMKKVERVLNRFDKVNKRSSQRRTKQAQKSSQNIQRITAAEVRHTMAIRRRMTRMIERDQRQRERDAIRSEKRQARERERILRRHAATRWRLLRGISRFGMRTLGLMGLGGGIGVIYKAREILKYDEALARMSVQADVTTKKQFEIRDAVNKASLAYGTQRDVIVEAFEEIVDKSGRLDLAADNVEIIAKILRGTRAEAKDVGALFAAISNAFKGTGKNLKNSEIAQFVEILVAQGDKAQINIANLASEGEKLFGAFKGAGFQSRRDLINFGALIQMAGETGTPEEAATSAVRVMSNMFKNTKKLRKKYGIDIFDKRGELRALDEIMAEIMTKTGQKKPEDVTKLFDIFGLRSVKTLQVLAAEWRNNNQQFSEFTRLINIGENAAGNIEKKFKRVAETASQGFERMFAGITLFADKALTDPLNDMADAFQRILDDPAALKQLESTARTLGSTLQAILHIAKTGIDIVTFLPKLFGSERAAEVGIRRKKIPKEYQHLIKEGMEYGGISQVIPGHLGRMEAELDRIEFMVQNNITVDEKGNVSKSDAILLAQINSDRGTTSVQKSIRQAKMR